MGAVEQYTTIYENGYDGALGWSAKDAEGGFYNYEEGVAAIRNRAHVRVALPQPSPLVPNTCGGQNSPIPSARPSGSPSTSNPSSGGCVDVAPSAEYTCEQQKAFQKCGETWMVGFCKKTCGTCGTVTPPAVKPPAPTPKPGPPTPPSTPTSGGNPSPYAKLLEISLNFYEAQRAGKLPANKRIPWRGDTFLRDGSDNGVDLVGGYMDAGDHYKFNFPMAFSMTTLAWGAIEYKAGYQSAGQWAYIKETIKWGTDYFLKCWKEDTRTLWGQVGNNAHSVWKAPEAYTEQELNSLRQSSAITPQKPGADLAAETAAALASASIVFKADDPTYSDLLLAKARTLYAFALATKGSVYSDSISEAFKYYRSWSGSNDELVWGAAWLYRATREAQYLDSVNANWAAVDWVQGPLTWDNKGAGAKVLMAVISKDAKFQTAARTWADGILKAGSTPDGLIWFDNDVSKWGSLRHAMNAMFPLVVYADKVETDATFKNRAVVKVIQQVGYVLGQNRMNVNYIVGAASNSPKRPHHRGASGTTEKDPGPNKNILYGALVGGPDQTGFWEDKRDDYVKNEVATDYNAGFTGIMARFVENAVGGVVITPPAPVIPVPTGGGADIKCSDVAHAEDPLNLYWVEVWAPTNSEISVQCADGRVIPCHLAFRVKFQCPPGEGNQCNHPRKVISGKGTTCPLPRDRYRADPDQAVTEEVAYVDNGLIDPVELNEEEFETSINNEVNDDEEANARDAGDDEDEDANDEDESGDDDAADAATDSSDSSSNTISTSLSPLAVALVVAGSVLVVALVVVVVVISHKKHHVDSV